MILGGFLAGSGGFWVYLKHKYEHKDAIERLIMGLAHDKIIHLGIKYIEKGFVSKDEYDDLIKYFWEPYNELAGDGSAERIVGIVKTLPLKPELRQFPEIRKLADGLQEGTERVIGHVERGDKNFERNEE